MSRVHFNSQYSQPRPIRRPLVSHLCRVRSHPLATPPMLNARLCWSPSVFIAKIPRTFEST